MSNHINQRIARLRNLVEGGLHQDNLQKIVSECDQLAQDTLHVLTFYVLRNLFRGIDSAIEGEAVTVERHKELTRDVQRSVLAILRQVGQNNHPSREELERLITFYYRNFVLFRG